MTIIASGITTIPTGVQRGYMIQPGEKVPQWNTIPTTGRPWVMIDREPEGANVLYNCWRQDMPSRDISAAYTTLRHDIEEARSYNPTARIGCWSVPGTEDTNDTAERRMDNRFAWPVVAKCDYCLLNAYIWQDAPADYWIIGCARIVREEFAKPICYGVQPLYAGGEHQLEVIAEDRFAQHIADIKKSGANHLWYWGEYRSLLQVGLSRVVNNSIDAAIVAAFDKRHADKLTWSTSMLASWCDDLDRRSLKIIKGVLHP